MTNPQNPKDFLRWLHQDTTDPQVHADIESMTDEQAAQVVLALKRSHYPDIDEFLKRRQERLALLSRMMPLLLLSSALAIVVFDFWHFWK